MITHCITSFFDTFVPFVFPPPRMRATNYSDAHADMTIIDYSAGTLKDMGLAQAKVVTMDDKTTMEITLKPGFDWLKEVRSRTSRSTDLAHL